MTVVATSTLCSKPPTIVPWKTSIVTYEPAWISEIRGSAAVQSQVAVPPADRIGQGMPSATMSALMSASIVIAARCLACRSSTSGVSEQ